MTGTEVERDPPPRRRRGRRDFVVGQGARAPSSTPTPTGCASAASTSATASPQQIVCGAPNVAAGQTVAVARPGAVMPDGTKLGKAKLRGVESDGMILAEDELAIGTDHAGIMVLDDRRLRPGTPLAEVLPIATDVLELEITPNRPDCLGVYGVAREVHAATGAALAAAAVGRTTPARATRRRRAGIEVIVEDAELCPRFTARVFENVTIGPVAAVAEGAPDRRRASGRSTTSSTSRTT